jgi:hypothetical protein
MTSLPVRKTWAPGREGNRRRLHTKVVDCRDLALVAAIEVHQYLRRETRHDVIQHLLSRLVLFDRMAHCDGALKDGHTLRVLIEDSFDSSDVQRESYNK